MGHASVSRSIKQTSSMQVVEFMIVELFQDYVLLTSFFLPADAALACDAVFATSFSQLVGLCTGGDDVHEAQEAYDALIGQLTGSSIQVRTVNVHTFQDRPRQSTADMNIPPGLFVARRHVRIRDATF